MNLAWLAAVLEPNDIAPHPNFRDDVYDGTGPARLANVVLGNPQRVRREAGSAEEEFDKDDPVTLAERCLRFDTMAVSVATLGSSLASSRPADQAQGAALALIVCSAAAEMDDYKTCFRALDAQLRWASEIRDPDRALLRAVLLQQKALRLQDAGQAHLETTQEVANALSGLDAEHCSSFQTSPGVSWSSHTTVERIRESLVAAAASLLPWDQPELAETVGLPTWQERIRAMPSSLATNTARSRADTYADYVEQVFARQFRSGARTVGGSARPDLFYSLLALELVGHGGVYGVRKECALLRLVQAGEEPWALADALRSLRHAASKNELDLALNRLREAGPLSALSDDARQILRTRLAPELLRTVEMQVLRSAADVLAPAEARAAFDAVLATLAAGGPSDLPGHWELPVLKKEVAWVAAAALSNVCGAASEVAEILLEEGAKVQQDDPLLDRALLRATAELDWAEVAKRIQDSWFGLLGTQGAKIPGTAELVLARLGRSTSSPVSSSAIDIVIHQLNIAMRGGPVDLGLRQDGVPLIREELAKIRSDAARLAYSFGGMSVADAAAGLVLYGGQDDLWPELTDFLLDATVPRQERTPAFERLARANANLPEYVRTRFHERAQRLLVDASPVLFDTPLNPYPAALRFLASYQLIDDAEVYDGIADLSGNANADGRREAAATVAVLAAKQPSSDLLALALPLSHDNEVAVRANAARALGLLVGLDQALASVARRRLQDLLLEDGLLVPLHALRALEKVPEDLRNAVHNQLAELANAHPSKSIRAEARRLLDN